MAKGPRRFNPSRIYEVSLRTFQAQFLLKPTPRLNKLIHGVIGVALERYDVQVHWYVFMSNHYHMALSSAHPWQLVRFLNFINSNVAREANRLQGRRGTFWDGPYEPLELSDEPGLAERRLAYLLGQGCKEGLVASPREWPGASPLGAVLRGEQQLGIWVDRTRMYHASCRKLGAHAESHYEHVVEVPLTPLPEWTHLNAQQQRDRIETLITDIEVKTDDDNAEANRQPLGAAAVMATDPQSAPATAKRQRSPRFLWLSEEVGKRMRTMYRAFVVEYRAASAAWRGGDLSAEFPPWCFPPGLPMVCGPPDGALATPL